jgi:hypothetical protein
MKLFGAHRADKLAGGLSQCGCTKGEEADGTRKHLLGEAVKKCFFFVFFKT